MTVADNVLGNFVPPVSDSPCASGLLARLPGPVLRANVSGRVEAAIYESSKTYPYPRGLIGPKIVYFWGLNGRLLPQNPLEKVGSFAPHLFQWALR